MASEEKNLTEESKIEEERPDQRTDNPTEVDDDRGGDLVIDEPEEKPDGDGESDERVRDILLFSVVLYFEIRTYIFLITDTFFSSILLLKIREIITNVLLDNLFASIKCFHEFI